MKKKISFLVCMLIAVLAMTTGCGAKKDTVQYDAQTVEQISEFIVQYCSTVDAESVEQLRSMRESTFEQQLAESGIPLTPSTFLGAIDSWKVGEEECGAYIEHGEYTFEAKGDELIVSTEAKFQNRDAEISLVYDDDLYLESVTISAHFSIGEILQKAGLNTLLGMGTVFVVLILISLIISLFKYIPLLQEKLARKPKAEAAATPVVEAAPVVETEDVTDDTELIAVIAAAIAAAEGTSTDGFVVRSIKRRKSNRW